MPDLASIYEELKAHKLEDTAHFEQMNRRFDGIDDQMCNLATKNDIKELRVFLANAKGTVATILYVGTIMAAIGGVVFGFQSLIGLFTRK